MEGVGQTLTFANQDLGQAEIVDIFNGLGTVVGKTITISTNPGYSLLSGADLAIATGKGWTVA